MCVDCYEWCFLSIFPLESSQSVLQTASQRLQSALKCSHLYWLQQVFERTWKFSLLGEGRQAGGSDTTKGQSLDVKLCNGVELI